MSLEKRVKNGQKSHNQRFQVDLFEEQINTNASFVIIWSSYTALFFNYVLSIALMCRLGVLFVLVLFELLLQDHQEEFPPFSLHAKSPKQSEELTDEAFMTMYNKPSIIKALQKPPKKSHSLKSRGLVRSACSRKN